MRPRGQISIAIEACLAHRGSATFLDIAHATQVSRRTAQCTLYNMLTCGRVEVVDQQEGRHGNRPMNVYRLRAVDPPAPSGVDVLLGAMRQFVPQLQGRR